ncbi:MAG: hypothetical protein QY326_01870 [Bdellovibrionota bacterium]|nr:MAG: hypothetical protein QY326_01870 [Bdellovibrionota bacterium]
MPQLTTFLSAFWTVAAATWCTGDIRASMTEDDVALVIERAKENFPGVTPRIISDNGPQFIAKDFKE